MRFDPKVRALTASIDETLTDIFGSNTPDYLRYSDCANIDMAPLIMGKPTPLDEIREGAERGKHRSVALLSQIIRSFEEKLEIDKRVPIAGGNPPFHPTPSAIRAQPNIGEIFVVHGHDEAARADVARFIEKAGLQPIILHERANQGRTLIEKFERHASGVSFAVVILTPDDVGGRQGEEPKPRARQNVVAELFYFIGKLGRERVCALKKGDIEIPSDIVGVVYIEMDGKGAWRTEVLRELESAGFSLDWKKALS